MDKKDKNTAKKITPIWFYFIMILIPIAFVILTEIILRTAGYGIDFTTFKQISTYHPDKLFFNPDLPLKYFTNPKSVPSVIPDGFDKEKKEKTFRVFVIGGSSTAGWPYVPNASFSRHLKRRLELIYTANKIEVINCGISAINSYSLRDFIPGIVEQKPDLIIFYAGHNEYYGALGVGSSVKVGNSRFLINSYIWLKDFRITQLMENLINSFYELFASENDMSSTESNKTLMARMIGESLIIYDSEIYWDGINQFYGNLRDVIRMIYDQNIPLIIGKLTSNTLDMKPFVSIRTDKYPRADSTYNLGRRAFDLGNIEEADSFLNLAKELDALRFRAPEAMNNVIDKLAAEFGCAVVDIDSLFRYSSQSSIVGYDLTVDHLHPNIEGYKLMALEFYNKMVQMNYLPVGSKIVFQPNQLESILENRFPFTMLDSTIAKIKIIQLTGNYPFVQKGAPNTMKLNYQIDSYIDSLSIGVINDDIKWETAHIKLGERYYSQHRFKEFIREVDAIIQERPYYDQPYEYLVTKLVDAGFVRKAIPYLRKLHSFKPSYFTNKWLGQLLLYLNNYKSALNYLSEAVGYPDADSQTWYNLAGAYYYDGKINYAINSLTKSLELNPQNKLAKNFLEEIQSLIK